MDTTLLPYRVKSARRKRRLQTEDRDRQLRRLEKEYKRLRKLKEELPWVPLEKPYQKGWKRLFVLRPDIQKGDKAEFYQQILDYINDVQYHYDESFKQPKRKGRWHRYYFESLPKLGTLRGFYRGNKPLELTPEQRACFVKAPRWDESQYLWTYHYEFTQPELFEIAVLPHLIYQEKLHDDGLERAMAFIDDFLYSPPNRDRLVKIQGGYYKNCYSRVLPERLKYVNPLKNKPFCRILDEYMDDSSATASVLACGPHIGNQLCRQAGSAGTRPIC
jgi:hypothetical protein